MTITRAPLVTSPAIAPRRGPRSPGRRLGRALSLSLLASLVALSSCSSFDEADGAGGASAGGEGGSGGGGLAGQGGSGGSGGATGKGGSSGQGAGGAGGSGAGAGGGGGSSGKGQGGSAGQGAGGSSGNQGGSPGQGGSSAGQGGSSAGQGAQGGSSAGQGGSPGQGGSGGNQAGSGGASGQAGQAQAGQAGQGGQPGGGFAIVTPLSLDKPKVAPGQTLSASITYQNQGAGAEAVQRVVITTRRPGATHGGGPFDDMAPQAMPGSVAPGAQVKVDASRTIGASDPVGMWEAYATYEDGAGVYHDGPSVFFEVEAGTTPVVPVAPGGFYVSGNTIYDSQGQPHVFRGVARPSFEWDAHGNNISQADFALMKSWNANVVRFAVSQDFWLPGAALYDASYQGNVDQAIQWAKAAGLDVIVDLHWSDKGDLQNTAHGQQMMADQNSIAFWKSFAQKYKGDGRVSFELYNEPHDIPWSVWLSGGQTDDGYQAVGMQQLYDTVRGEGADNLVLIGGLSYAFDLSGVPDHRVKGYNIAYVTHNYDYPNQQPNLWDAAYGFLTATDPVVATEFGNYDCSTGYYSAFLDYADQHKMGWTAWAWWVGGCKFPSLLEDWQGTPSPPGVLVKAALAKGPPQ